MEGSSLSFRCCTHYGQVRIYRAISTPASDTEILDSTLKHDSDELYPPFHGVYFVSKPAAFPSLDGCSRVKIQQSQLIAITAVSNIPTTFDQGGRKRKTMNGVTTI